MANEFAFVSLVRLTPAGPGTRDPGPRTWNLDLETGNRSLDLGDRVSWIERLQYHPPVIVDLVLLFAGVICLGFGAHYLVEGASGLALRARISPMVVGITVVGFGTSLPELLVSVLASLRDSASLGLGNAVGSNIVNLLLVLGAAAMVRPIVLHGSRSGVVRDLIFGLVPVAILFGFARDGYLERLGAALLIVVFILFISFSLLKPEVGGGELAEPSGRSATAEVVALIGGLIGVLAGSELLVRGGVSIARDLGVSEAVIGLSMVAIGTSLPELATSLTAAFKGQIELGVGNILGSNVFNLGLVVGTAFSIRPSAVPMSVITLDLATLSVVTLAIGALLRHGDRISRRTGIFMVGLFSLWLISLTLR